MIDPKNVIKLWKLLLYKPYQNSNLVKRIKKQLADLKIDLVELIAVHLNHVIQDAKKVVKQSILIGGNFKEGADSLPTKVFLSVPQMWKPPANRIMLQAAKRADIGPVELVYEPVCAAAFYTYDKHGSLHPEHALGYEILVCDIGGGTADYLRMRYSSGFQAGAKAKFKCVGVAKGIIIHAPDFLSRVVVKLTIHRVALWV